MRRGLTCLVVWLLLPALSVGAADAEASLYSAAFASLSYRPGAVATLRIQGSPGTALQLQIFEVGGESAYGSAATADDLATTGMLVGAPITVRTGTRRVWIGDWPSGVYVARLTGPEGRRTYAPLIVRPRQLGDAHVLVVEPTNTWQAYNDEAGDSWYFDPAVHTIDLTRPYLGDGLPPHFRDYDLGFLRWYWQSGHRADFISDADLERFGNGAQLRRLYRLIVFPGHEEYVTPHVYDLIARYRDDGGNLAFLSADNFFYRVTYSGESMIGRTRWRDLGRPEAALVGAQYAGWDERTYRNKPLIVSDTAAAPWLFAGTGLGDGSRFGRFGIEIDERTPASPPGTVVLAHIPHEFGPRVSAQMTLYHRDGATVFDAGLLSFGGSADWPIVTRLLDNLWQQLDGETPN